jgi:predicted permease
MIAADFVYLDRSTAWRRRLARFRKRCTPGAIAKVVVWVVMPALLFAVISAGYVLAAAKQVH